MPYDPHGQDDDDDDQDLAGQAAGARRRFNDFDCPDCSANNPYDDGFGDGEDVICYYCGQEFRVQVNESGKLKL